MISVIASIGTQHDPWLVALAALVAALGSVAAQRLLTLALRSDGVVRVGWAFLTAMVVATATWATHFVALLAYHVEAPVSYHPTLTLLSLLAAVCGAFGSFALASAKRNGPLPLLGGVGLGLTIAAMHYVGLLAYRIDALVNWNAGYLVASVLLAVTLSSLSIAASRRQLGRLPSEPTAAVLLFAAILSLHFTGMTAIDVVSHGSASNGVAEGAAELALATALASATIVGAGAFAYLIDSHNRSRTRAWMDSMALTDSLTGLPNREAAAVELAERLASAQAGERLNVLVLEIAGMDGINQRFGTRIGDLVLQAIANRLREARRPGVLIARTSNARFFGVSTAADRDDALRIARRVHALLSQDLLVEGNEIPIDIRIGLALYPDDATDVDGLVRRAQTAVARAKADPLNPIAVHDEMSNEEAQRRLRLANELRGALARGEFELFYQPQVRVVDMRVVGYEALLRWRHPELGWISPAEFVPLAETTGAIVEIGEWALRTACAQAAAWPGRQRVSVNLSPLQLRQPEVAERIHESLLASGLSPGRLEIELTESLLVDDRQRALHVLRRIKALGVRIALDDFGTGYSSMEVLRTFPFDKVKLDKSFLEEIEIDPQARAILQAMLTLGRALGVPILAEGVESERQLAILAGEGCSEVQGFLTGRPATAADLRGWYSLRRLAS